MISEYYKITSTYIISTTSINSQPPNMPEFNAAILNAMASEGCPHETRTELTQISANTTCVLLLYRFSTAAIVA
jgi:hypothetical protein